MGGEWGLWLNWLSFSLPLKRHQEGSEMAITGKQEILNREQTRPYAFYLHATAAYRTAITLVYIIYIVSEMC